MQCGWCDIWYYRCLECGRGYRTLVDLGTAPPGGVDQSDASFHHLSRLLPFSTWTWLIYFKYFQILLIVDWFWLLIDFVELIFDWWIVAKGDPSPHISWISSGDGSPLADIPALRQATASNGTLTYWPFAATHYRPDIHSGTIRCSASNSAGTVLSRDVKIRAGQLNSFNWQLD